MLSVAILLGYLSFVILDLERNIGSIKIRHLTVLAAMVVFCWCLVRAHKTGGRWIDLVTPLNVFLSILTLLAFSNLAFSVLRSLVPDGDTPTAEEKVAMDTYNRVRFKFKPNIYLIVPDSYPSNPVLKRFFSFDNRSFNAELEQLGFRVYDRYFSSYSTSLESMHSMFSMNHNYCRKSMGQGTLGLRAVIAGRKNNVIDILKNNGYESIYVHETDYLVKGNCFIKRCLPSLTTFERLLNNLKNFYFFRVLVASRLYDVGAEMVGQIDRTCPGSQRFIYKHFMDAHSNVKSYEKHYLNKLDVFRKNYPKQIRGTNKILVAEASRIIAKDPTAIVIIVADHGTWGGAERTPAGLSEDEILDKFNVFLAIRWGSAYHGQYDTSIKTGVNLFRFIFAYLGQDESIIRTKTADDSYLRLKGIWKTVEDGKVMREPKCICAATHKS